MATTTEDAGSDSDDLASGIPEEVEPETSGQTQDTVAALAGKAPETINLVKTIDEDEQQKIADACYDDWKTDWDSSEKYRQKRAQLLKLCIGELPEKEDGYAQIHYPIVMKALIKLHARVYDQQFPSSGEYWGCRPTSAADLPRCVRVSKHLNWQTLHQIEEYVPNHDRMIFEWYQNGSAFSFMYWSPTRNRPCHEMLATDDVILPYAYPQQGADPSLSGIPRITRVVRKHRFGPDGLDALAKSGYYDQVNVDAIFADDDDGKNSNGGGGGGGGSSTDGEMSSPVREAVDRAVGVAKPTNEKPTLRVLLEQHRWWKLKGWNEYRPVIVTIDQRSKKLVAFIVREDEDPEDRARYNREKTANEASYQAAMAQYEQDLTAYYAGIGMQGPTPGMASVTEPPIPGPTAMAGPPEPGATTMGEMPAEGEMTPSVPLALDPNAPQAPLPPADPAPPRMIPINFFTHYICIPNPEGIYGYGIGYLLEGNNITADALGSALVTAGAISTMPMGIRSRELKLRGGEFKVRPGEIVEVDCLPSEMKDALQIFKFPPPEPLFGQVIKDMKEEAEELSGASDILSGEVGGSNETATTTQIRISQALAAISIQNKRYTRARTEEGKKLARLNSVYLGDAEYFSVIDPFHNTPPQDQHISRADYLVDTAITVTADPRMASQPQRLQEAIQAIQITQQLAAVVPGLAANVPLNMALLKNVYTAMDRPDLVALAMQAPPPMPMSPGPPQPPRGAQPQPGAGQGAPRPHPQPAGPSVPNTAPGAAPTNAANAGA